MVLLNYLRRVYGMLLPIASFRAFWIHANTNHVLCLKPQMNQEQI